MNAINNRHFLTVSYEEYIKEVNGGRFHASYDTEILQCEDKNVLMQYFTEYTIACFKVIQKDGSITYSMTRAIFI